MKALIYEMIGLGLLLSCGYLLYHVVSFLAQKDYVAAVLGICAAFVVVKAGVDMCRLAIFIGRQHAKDG